MFQTKVVENIRTHFMFNNFRFSKIMIFLLANVEKYCRAEQVTDDDITWRMRMACWIPKATYTHKECVLLCHWNI